ncbi:alpha/beta hydrolase [Nodularia harveyana UHCC-0300]|uniref:Alpha/beta hydrolase n=1 Tax=Nodularia harveyana UHCC-0300 TaxID=2974287 RepID=A0ABU5UJI3_9CYAN|nr:alpha/beta hydrolase [Nodularia harveyana]MEA5583131.1 alpha/beta hydrolase [Nodularia harveyana UHCC-0300]
MLNFDQFPSKYATVNDGVKLHYRLGGQGTPVILLHGWMGSSHTWRKIAPILAQTHTVVVPDMRGYGASDITTDGYDAVNSAKDILGILEAEGFSKAHVVGHDMGALVAMAFAGTFADITHTLTYLDEPLVGYNLEGFTSFKEESHGGFWHFGLHYAPGLVEILYKGHEQELVDYIMPLMAANKDAVTTEDRKIYAASLLRENGITGNVGWYRAAFETGKQLRAIGDQKLKVPVLAYGGQYGVSITCEQMKIVSDRVTGGIVANCGHLLPEEAPEFLAEKMTEFFQQHQ